MIEHRSAVIGALSAVQLLHWAIRNNGIEKTLQDISEIATKYDTKTAIPTDKAYASMVVQLMDISNIF